MKKKILIIAGGYSNEREISLKTARSVYLELKKNKKYIIDVAKRHAENIRFNIDVKNIIVLHKRMVLVVKKAYFSSWFYLGTSHQIFYTFVMRSSTYLNLLAVYFEGGNNAIKSFFT